MTSLKINVTDDSNLPFLIELLDKFDFVEIDEVKNSRTKLSPSVKRALKEVEAARLGKIKLTSWNEFKKTV